MLLFSYNKFLHNLKNATSKVTYEFSIQDDEKMCEQDRGSFYCNALVVD